METTNSEQTGIFTHALLFELLECERRSEKNRNPCTIWASFRILYPGLCLETVLIWWLRGSWRWMRFIQEKPSFAIMWVSMVAHFQSTSNLFVSANHGLNDAAVWHRISALTSIQLACGHSNKIFTFYLFNIFLFIECIVRVIFCVLKYTHHLSNGP